MMRITSYKPYGVGFGATLTLIGLAMIWSISRLPDTAAYATVGPKVFPWLVGGGLAFIGLAVIHEAMTAEPEAAEPMEYDVLPILMISVSLIFAALTLEWLGWIIAATGVFWVTAWAFGERRWLISLLIGICLSGATHLLFNQLLQLSLPGGILGF